VWNVLEKPIFHFLHILKVAFLIVIVGLIAGSSFRDANFPMKKIFLKTIETHAQYPQKFEDGVLPPWRSANANANTLFFK